jgi:hypothetical protein
VGLQRHSESERHIAHLSDRSGVQAVLEMEPRGQSLVSFLERAAGPLARGARL